MTKVERIATIQNEEAAKMVINSGKTTKIRLIAASVLSLSGYLGLNIAYILTKSPENGVIALIGGALLTFVVAGTMKPISNLFSIFRWLSIVLNVFNLLGLLFAALGTLFIGGLYVFMPFIALIPLWVEYLGDQSYAKNFIATQKGN